MPLTAEQGFKTREEHSTIKEKEVCDAHGLTQIGGSRTKIDGTDGVNNKSIKNMSGSSTQVHLTTQKHFIKMLNISGDAAEFIAHFVAVRVTTTTEKIVARLNRLILCRLMLSKNSSIQTKKK